MATKAFQKIYTKISQITKATCSLKATGVGYDELAMVNGKLAQVVKIMGDEVTLQVFQGTEGIPTNAEVVFLGKSPSLKVSEQLAGRFFNAFGDPIDGGPEIEGKEIEIGGPSVNPVRRKQPSELIATGIAGIDLNNTLVSGQKIPFFADPDQPFNQVMANVALRAETDKIILGGMGMTNDDYLYFKNVFSNAGALDRIISFVNTTENPPVERLLIPDMALTAAEYFAVEHNQKVLVLLTDMTSYADALAIVSNRMDQIPSKDSMPGSLYSDLAKIYEKAVQFPAGGSITIIAVTTLSGGDITHAVPDNTGYITEGQLFLRRDSDIGKVIVDPFRSLSRLKQLVSGKEKGVTKVEVRDVANYLLVMFHCKIFSSSQSHIRNQQTFYRRIFSCIHETDDTVERTCIREDILEIQVVVIGHTHTTQDNLVCFCTKGHVRHHLVKRLVRVSKERDLLTRNQCIVQVDTSDTCCNQFRRLLTTNRIHRRTTDFYFLTFNFRTTVNRITERIEETASQLFTHLQTRRLAQEYYFCIGWNTFCTLEYLQCHFIAHDLYHLGQLTIYHSQFIITSND